MSSKNRSDLSVLIDGAIGELSLFHQTYSYYAHGNACRPSGSVADSTTRDCFSSIVLGQIESAEREGESLMATILIVDDEQSIRDTLACFLKLDGYAAITARDSDEARDALGRHSVDVVVTDIVLPRRSGVELLHYIRQAAPGVPVIMMTGEPTLESAIEAVKAGAYDYLTKPIGKNLVLTAVHRAAAFKDLFDEKVRLERLNREYQDHLELLVQQRTAALAGSEAEERESTEAKERADAANRAKSVFLANMSHEIRTPMNAILGYTQLMQKIPGLSAQQEQYLKVISRSGEHLLGLINDVLEMSKIEAGRVTVNPTSFDLRDVVADLETMFRIRTDEKGLTLQVVASPDVPQLVTADEGKVRQVLINMLGNAVKFTSRGGIVLRVRARSSEDEEIALECEVEDTGWGIAENDLGRVFDAFEQTESGRRQGTGTGLGMAISRQHARLMKGDLTVTSQIGRGTTFLFSFPVLRSSVEQAASGAPRLRPVSLAPDSPARRALVVDDRETNRNVLAIMLQQVGFEIREASSGEEAVRQFMEWRPDVILMDMSMPGVDGKEATRTIKAMPQGDRTPIIMVTASALEEKRGEAMEAGAGGFVQKPFREEEILEEIRRVANAKYLYSEPQAVQTGINSGTVAQDVLATLPPLWIEAMKQAVEAAELDRMSLLIDEISASHPDTARAWRTLVDRYDYVGLSNVLSGPATK